MALFRPGVLPRSLFSLKRYIGVGITNNGNYWGPRSCSESPVSEGNSQRIVHMDTTWGTSMMRWLFHRIICDIIELLVNVIWMLLVQVEGNIVRRKRWWKKLGISNVLIFIEINERLNVYTICVATELWKYSSDNDETRSAHCAFVLDDNPMNLLWNKRWTKPRGSWLTTTIEEEISKA